MTKEESLRRDRDVAIDALGAAQRALSEAQKAYSLARKRYKSALKAHVEYAERQERKSGRKP